MTYHGRVKDGVIVLDDPSALPDGTEVEVTPLQWLGKEDVALRGVQIPPRVTEERDRRKLLQKVTERMRANEWPEGIARFTRDQLHERR